ncbi:MAG: glycosyltransferase, partial [Candidatus Latescibacteria bacterium]|nr:glycosyltransferase [Candidatus Latescibacterota bacterium]
MERITVIIPTLNEAETIGSMLSSLSQQVVEVIVVDGGSGDSIREIANKFPEVTLITSQPGRAMQMNAGAEAASGDVLLFLHADTALPDGGLEL